MARAKDTGEKIADIEKRLAEDEARLEGLHADMGDGDPSGRSIDASTRDRINAVFRAIDDVMQRAELMDLTQTRQRASESRTKLLYAVHTAQTAVAYHGLDLAQPDLQTMIRELAAAERAFNAWAETGTWPLTISPNKPPRVEPADDWEKVAEIAGDDDPVGEYKPRGGFLSTTGGKIAAASAVVLALRWVMK